MPIPRFPFSAPPRSQQRPDLPNATAATFIEFADALDWLLIHRGRGVVTSAAPIRRWVASLRAHAASGSVLAVPNAGGLLPGSTGWLAAVADFCAACFAGHAVLTLEGEHSSGHVGRLDINENFVIAELGSNDFSLPGAPVMPSGLGTLLCAADCARVGAARLSIFGSDSPALDVEWEALNGGLVRFEAKGRAFARAFDPAATPQKLAEWAVKQVSVAAPALRKRCKRDGVAGRALQIVRLTALAPRELARALHHADWNGLMTQALKPSDPHIPPNAYTLPHGVVVHWFGIGDGAMAGWESRPRYMDVTEARPRAEANAIAAFHELVGRPPDAPPGLRPRT